jgi:thioredoxin reductase (NADPH)
VTCKGCRHPQAFGLAYLMLVRMLSWLALLARSDVRYRSVKRVASAVGEGAMAVQLVHEYLGELDS